MTISLSTARRKYFERSSLTSARGTTLVAGLGGRALRIEPALRLGFRDDREDLDLRFCNVIEHPDVANPQAILRLAQTSESLDSALADLRRLVRQVQGKRLRDARS
ncbi:MAG: hypothetical protein ACRD09_06410, partial [Vicinamibacterales bacterium]